MHRVERLSAFVGCLAHEGEEHAAQFLICRNCSRVTEIEDGDLAHALADAAAKSGVQRRVARPSRRKGICAGCRAADLVQ